MARLRGGRYRVGRRDRPRRLFDPLRRSPRLARLARLLDGEREAEVHQRQHDQRDAEPQQPVLQDRPLERQVRVPEVQLAASPRATLALMKISQVMSLFEGREFVTPEAIQSVAVDVIAHRLVLAPESKYSGMDARGMVGELIAKVPAPV